MLSYWLPLFGDDGGVVSAPDQDNLIQWLNYLKPDAVTLNDRLEVVTPEPTLVGVNCLEFDGTTSAYGIVTAPTREEFEGSCWVYANSSGDGTRRTIIEGYGGGVGNSYEAGFLELTTLNLLRLGGAVIPVVDAVFPTDEWAFVEWKISLDGSYLRINGDQYDGISSSTDPNYQGFVVGSYRSLNGRWFDGKLSQLKIVDTVDAGLAERKGLISYDRRMQDGNDIALTLPMWSTSGTDALPSSNHSDGFSTPDYFMIAVVGDTQYLSLYATDQADANIKHKEIYDWIVDNRVTEDIRATLHLGDVTQSFATDSTEFDRAITAQASLEATDMPFGLVGGNHDFAGADSTMWNTYYPTTRYASQDLDAYGFETAGKSENFYMKFTAYENSYLVVGLNFDPTQAEVDWAKGIFDANPDSYGILIIHEWMGINNDIVSRYVGDPAYTGVYPVLTPTEAWVTLKTCTNIAQIWSGHLQSTAGNYALLDNGLRCQQFLFDNSLGTNVNKTTIGRIAVPKDTSNICQADSFTTSTEVEKIEGPFPLEYPFDYVADEVALIAAGVDTTGLLMETYKGATVVHGTATLEAENGAVLETDAVRGSVMKFTALTQSQYHVVDAPEMGPTVTIAFWVKNPYGGRFIDVGSWDGSAGGEGGWSTQDYSKSRICATTRVAGGLESSYYQYQNLFFASDDEWVHFAHVFYKAGSSGIANNVSLFYRNGELLNPELNGAGGDGVGHRLQAENTRSFDGYHAVGIGRSRPYDGTPLESFDGSMDSVCLYDRVLDLNEINVLYKRGLQNLTSSPETQP